MVKIRVPATSANMGPGFDCMGIALGLYCTVTFEEADDLVITGCPSCYATERNLCYLGYREAMQKMGFVCEGVHLHIESEIPVARGLGSSAALLTAGVFGANALHGNRLSYPEMLAILNRLEGHPDNVAPALYGGMTAGFVGEDGMPFVEPYAVNEKLHFTVVIPDFRVSTWEARKLLPKTVSLSDAVYNLSRSAVLCKAIERGDTATIGMAMKDKLHQKYRRTLIPGYNETEKAALQAGACAFCISGSGSTMLAVSDTAETADILKDHISAHFPDWTVKELATDPAGACVIR